MTVKEEEDLKLVSLKNIQRNQCKLTFAPHQVFTKLVNQKLEEPLTGAGAASQFLVQRSPSFDGMLDVNVKRYFVLFFAKEKNLIKNPF